MNDKTDNLELNINYRSPSKQVDMKEGYDENFKILDNSIQLILGTLENTDLEFKKSIDLSDFASEWEIKEWNNIYAGLNGDQIWINNNNVYYSDPYKYSNLQLKLNQSTDTWEQVSWTSPYTVYGNQFWSDGDNLYYSSDTNQRIIDENSNFNIKIWNGYSRISGQYIWTDGDNIYYSYVSYDQYYVLDKATSTWSKKIWNGESCSGNYIWTDGKNIYYSNWNNHYILNKETSTWETKIWNGYNLFAGYNIWTNGEDIFLSQGTVQKVLDISTSTWIDKIWVGLNDFFGKNIWKFNGDIYYSEAQSSGREIKNYKLKKIT